MVGRVLTVVDRLPYVARTEINDRLVGFRRPCDSGTGNSVFGVPRLLPLINTVNVINVQE